MRDRPISLTAAGAIVSWTASFTLIGVSFRFENEWGQLGLAMCGVALMLSIRVFVMQLCRELKSREHNAFELGRDSADLRQMNR